MPDSFAITVATNNAVLDSVRQGRTSFTVSNTTARGARARARIAAQPASAASWLTLLGEAERDFASDGSQQYTVQISVPPTAPPGSYTFRLDMVDLANPDDDVSEGPTVRFVVEPPVPVKKPFPWWIVVAVIVGLILVGGVIYGLVRVTHTTATVVTPTATVSKPTVTAVPARWQEVASIPGGRTAFAAVTGRDGLIYVMGGSTSGNGYLAAVLVYNPHDARAGWKSLPASMTTPRIHFAAVVGPDGRIYAIGGAYFNNTLASMEVYDPNNPAAGWRLLPGSLNTPRSSFAAVFGPDGNIYVLGGYDNNHTTLASVEMYNPTNPQAGWSVVPASMTTPRAFLAAVVGPDGRIYAIGGYDSASNPLKSVETYVPGAPNWTPAASMQTNRSELAAVVGPDGRIYALGGNDRGHLLNTVEVYDTKNGKWSPGVSMITAHFRFNAVLGPDKFIYAIGGVDNNGETNLGVEAYFPR